MLEGGIVAGLAAVFLGVQAWAHHRSLLSEREAGEQRLQALRSLLDEAHEMARNDWHAGMERMAATYETTLDRLQARSVLEYQAARQVAATPPPVPEALETWDADYDEPSFARPAETAPLGIGADE